jgi:hypothetical protein
LPPPGDRPDTSTRLGDRPVDGEIAEAQADHRVEHGPQPLLVNAWPRTLAQLSRMV